MGNIAIIPARGGSKRIPKKNIKLFLGKPIIAYSIETALESGLFDEVMVSTDDEEIAKIALQYGAKVPFIRSANTADDFATTADVIFEVLEKYKTNGLEFENCCCIYPCAPLVTIELLLKVYAVLNKSTFETVFPVMPFSYPIQRSVKIENEKISLFQPEYRDFRSQDLEKAYHDSGQFYFLKANSFLEKKLIISDNTGAVVISELDAHDIDNETDWKIAELKYRLKNGG
jgi:pseudaminic acid cytidylyltransferase